MLINILKKYPKISKKALRKIVHDKTINFLGFSWSRGTKLKKLDLDPRYIY